MAVNHRIDHVRRVVFVTCSGTLTSGELFRFQQEVWSRPELGGFSALVDVRGVQIELPENVSLNLRELAALGARMDARHGSRLAIVVSDDLAFGLGRMYEAYRELEPGSTREVSVFRSMHEAAGWLGIREESGR
jgi:hypothetical protein